MSTTWQEVLYGLGVSDTTDDELQAIPYQSQMLPGAFCPDCGSDDVNQASPVTFVCEACGHDGPQYKFFTLSEEDYR